MTRSLPIGLVLLLLGTAFAGSGAAASKKLDAAMLLDLDLLSDANFTKHADAPARAETEQDSQMLDMLDWLDGDDSEPSDKSDRRGAR
jgi:hypothetical protein